MEIRTAASPKDFKHYTTERLREEFLVQGLFVPGKTKLVYSHIDRIITGGVMPLTPIKLTAGEELRAKYFCDRRELGVINIGGKGVITVDGKDYTLESKDGIYIGMGSKEITFASLDQSNPTLEESNHRVINKYILPGQVESCQLEMGMTELKPGSVWNTMPCHTHDRRMEVYLYFNMPENAVVMHYMGEPSETRHLVMRNEEAVISPSWSIHSGSGSQAYTFIWGMVGENQDFNDMDHVKMTDLR